jgi:PAS domain S-box-containing protein
MDGTKITNGKASESGERFKLFFENAPLGYQSLDEDGCFIGVNERWTRILGYSQEEVIGKWFGDFLAKQYVEGFKERFKLFKSQGEIHSEFEMLKKDGSTIFVAFDGRIGYTPLGGFKQTHCVLNDITERKQTEKSLANSEERFRNAVMNAPFPIMIHAEDGKVELVNDEWLAVTGYSREDLSTTANWAERAYGIRKEIAQEDIERLYGITGKVDEGEYQVTTKSGAVRSWYFSSTPLGKTDDGRRLAMSMALDFTARKKAQQDLKESEEKFRSLFEYSPVGKSMTGIDGSLHVNKVFCDIVGYSKAELQGMKWQDFTHPEDIGLSVSMTESLLEGKISHARFEKRYIHKNGNIVWADVSTYLHINNGQPQFFITTIIDITKRKQTDILLKESEEKYRSLVEVSTDAIFINQRNQITYLNRSALKLFGATTPEQIIGKSPLEMFHPDFHEAISQRIANMLDKDVVVPLIEEKIIQLDGTVVDVEVAATSFTLKGDLAIQVVLRDITERKQALEKIKTFNEDLEKQVQQRTVELNETINELEEQTRVFVGRELRMIELKERIEELEKQLMDKR